MITQSYNTWENIEGSKRIMSYHMSIDRYIILETLLSFLVLTLIQGFFLDFTL